MARMRKAPKKTFDNGERKSSIVGRAPIKSFMVRIRSEGERRQRENVLCCTPLAVLSCLGKNIIKRLGKNLRDKAFIAAVFGVFLQMIALDHCLNIKKSVGNSHGCQWMRMACGITYNRITPGPVEIAGKKSDPHPLNINAAYFFLKRPSYIFRQDRSVIFTKPFGIFHMIFMALRNIDAGNDARFP